MNYNSFRKKVIKAKTKKKFKVRNSYGTKQVWRWLKKNKWLGLENPITEKDFGLVIREVNKLLVEQLLSGHDIILPHRMGRIELRKYKTKIEYKDGKLITNLPVDWKRTLKYWHNDESSYKEKKLIRQEVKEVFRIVYSKKSANYNNKSFYQFIPNRDLKIELSKRIKEHKIDAFLGYAVH